MTPSNANTSGLEVVAWRWRFRVDAVWNYQEAQQHIPDVTCEPLVTAASAQARIAELSASMTQQADQWSNRLSVMADRATAAEARADRLAKALERIERWFGEFPETGKFWHNADGSISDRPMPYGACWGSNGERDYMRSVARAALQQETQP